MQGRHELMEQERGTGAPRPRKVGETTYYTDSRSLDPHPPLTWKRLKRQVDALRETRIADLLSIFRRHRKDIEADDATRAAGRDSVARVGLIGYEPDDITEAYRRFKKESATEDGGRTKWTAVRTAAAGAAPARGLLAAALVFAGLSAASPLAGWSATLAGWYAGMGLGLAIGWFCVFCTTEGRRG